MELREIRNNEIKLLQCSYYGDIEGLYQIGSMTKAFTGLAIQKTDR